MNLCIRNARHFLIVALAGMLCFAPTKPLLAQRYQYKPPSCNKLHFRATREPNRRILEPGSIIMSRLREGLSTKKAKLGDPVEAFVSTPITDDNGVLLVPRNSIVRGQIDRVQRARLGRPAVIEVGFNTLQRCIFLDTGLPPPHRNLDADGCYRDEVQLGAVMVPLNEENCGDINEDRFVQGRRVSKRNTLKFTGAGAGGGALLGGLAAGTALGLGIGAGIGAGVGLVLALTAKDREIDIPPGALFGVELTHPLPLRALDQELLYPSKDAGKKSGGKSGGKGGQAGGKGGGGAAGGGGGAAGGGGILIISSGRFRRCTGLAEVAAIRERTESLMATHANYLTGRGFDASESFFLRNLVQLRVPLAEFTRASSREACREAASSLYTLAEGADSSLDRERAVPDRMPEKTATRWNTIHDLIFKVANVYRVAY